eukprot:5536982-Amphidinium_carterae.1
MVRCAALVPNSTQADTMFAKTMRSQIKFVADSERIFLDSRVNLPHMLHSGMCTCVISAVSCRKVTYEGAGDALLTVKLAGYCCMEETLAGMVLG